MVAKRYEMITTIVHKGIDFKVDYGITRSGIEIQSVQIGEVDITPILNDVMIGAYTLKESFIETLEEIKNELPIL